MLEMGLVVGIALLFTMAKMNWHWRLRILSNPFLVDCLVFALLCFLHWGTFTGVMVATIGALVCSTIFTVGRKAVGYMEDGDYVPGLYNISEKLN